MGHLFKRVDLMRTWLLEARPSSTAPTSSRTQRLWKDYFSDPSRTQRLHNHKLTKESLPGCHNPGWVKGTLNKMETANKLQLHMLSLEEALSSLECLPHPPSVEDLTCILCKCRKHKKAAYAMRLHAYLLKNGLEAHQSLGNHLVPMLVEVGSMCDALQVFDMLAVRNEYSWTSLITGYIECGDLPHAFLLYQKMQEDLVHPNGYTFVALLKACATLKDTERGQEFHAEIMKKGLLEKDPFVGSTLVDMYAKCGLLAKSQEVFDILPVRNAVSWTALMAGYAEYGLGQDALNCFKQMQLEGICPDAVTLVCSLKACGNIGAIDKGQELHAQIERKGWLETNLFISSTLVDMYAKCGSFIKAREVFDKIPVRDAVSWNALIAGYADHGLGQDALNCFEQMQLEGISPDVVAFVCSLKACGSIGAIDKGQEIHAQLAMEGLSERDLFVGNTLVDMYAKCGLLAKAQGVFDKLPVRDAVSWNALIAGYAEHGLGHEALNCFEQMQLEGVSPSPVTYACSLKACGIIGAIDKGQELHPQIASKGLLERDPFLGNTLVDMYAKCGLFEKAYEVFQKLPVRDAVSWNALIAGYVEYGLGKVALHCFEQMQLEGISPDAVSFVCSLKACGSIGAIDKGQDIHAQISTKGLSERDPFIGSTLVDMYAKCGMLAKAQEVFDKLPVRDEISWTALIAGYAEHGFSQDALNCFEQMQVEGVSPDAVTFVCSLKACGSIGAIEKGREIHTQIATKGLSERDRFIGNTLIDMYAKCALLATAREVFDTLLVRDAVSWNALIAGYAHLGDSENVFLMLGKMRAEDIKPNVVTFLSILTVCSHTGLVEKGQTYFEAMINDYGITPTIEHHACMVDLLGRAGQLDKAVVMIKKTLHDPDLVLWLTLLGACRKWGNVELGRWAFEHAVELDKKDAGAYVLMSNIYADAHMQEDAKQVKVMGLREQAWQKPGQSLTDFGGIVYSFLVGDTCSQSDYIYAKQEDLSFKRRKEGYVPDLRWLCQDIPDKLKESGLCGHSQIACALD